MNTSSVEGTDRRVFDQLKEQITEYLNENKWGTAQFSANEKIECRIFLTVKEYTNERIKGDIQVQSTRPVYNSTYTTPVLNFKDNKIEFDFSDGDRLVRNDNSWEGNLTGILDFYAYFILALDFDTFSPKGGQPYFDKAASIVQMAQSSGEIGWRTFEDNKNRSALLSAFTDTNTGMMRELLYKYHRKGLDEMSTSPDKGRASITEAVAEIGRVYENAPMSVALSIFRDSKLDELVNVYSKAPQTEREKVYDILKPIYPTDTERLEKIKKPEELQ